MKLIFITMMLAAFAPAAFGAPQSMTNCLKQVVENERIVTENIDIACAKRNPAVMTGLKYLCSTNESDISAEYRSYHSYDLAYREAKQVYLSAPDAATRARARQKMSFIEQNWEVAGFKTNIGNAIGKVGLNFHCSEVY